MRVPTEKLERQVERELAEKGRRAVTKMMSRLEECRPVYVNPDVLTCNTWNPNRQDDREYWLLVRSMKEEGFTTPILVNRDNVIIDGEHRWRAACQLGFREIPVVYVDMEDIQAQISTLRHNRARGSEDIELSVKVLSELQELGALAQAMVALELDEEYVNLLLTDEVASDGLAGEEYNLAWEPEPTTAEVAEDAESQVTLAFGEAARRSVTDSAQAIVQRVRDEIEQAVSQEERVDLRREMQRSIFTLQVMFPGTDAVLVKEVLEPTPASRLLALCEAYWRKNGCSVS